MFFFNIEVKIWLLNAKLSLIPNILIGNMLSEISGVVQKLLHEK